MLTTAIALWPVAYSQIVRDPQARLIRLAFDHRSPETRTLGSFALFNGGNVDAYVTRVELEVIDTHFKDIGTTKFRLYELLKKGEGLEKDIAYQGIIGRKKASVSPLMLDRASFSIVKTELTKVGLPLDRCLSLFPFDARLGLKAPEDKPFRNAEAVANLTGMVYYLDRGNPEIEIPSKIQDLYIEAAIMLEPGCIRGLGGLKKVEALILGN